MSILHALFTTLVFAPFASVVAAQQCGCPLQHDGTLPNPTGTTNIAFGGYTLATLPNGSGGQDVFVGAPYDDTLGSNAGAVFQIDLGTGVLVRTLVSPNPQAGAQFGTTVARIGDRIAVGAPYDDTAGPDVGAAYVFDGASGALQLTLLPQGAVAGAFFSFPTVSVGDLDGDDEPEIAAGAMTDTSAGIGAAGAAYLFDGATGVQLRRFQSPQPGLGQLFGSFVAGDDGKLLVGEAYDASFGPSQSGSAHLFDAATGALLRTFNNPTPGSGDHFGEWVALHGDKVVVTAHLDDTRAFNGGGAYLLSAQTGSLLFSLFDPTPDFQGNFGYGVAVSATEVIVSSLGDDQTGNDAGAAYLYRADTGALTCQFFPPNPTVQATFGFPVGFSGTDVLIGEGSIFSVASIPGSVELFRRNVVDSDGDCLSDVDENALGTDPFDPDSDDDGLDDGEEVATHGTNPLDPDTDDDGLLDGTEVDMAQGSGCPDPLDHDSDGDGLADGLEVATGTNACNPDTDADGVPDGTDPLPTEPGVTCGFLEQMLRSTAEFIEALDLSLFNGPNANANSGRRNALATHVHSAANHLCGGQGQSALANLDAVLEKVDDVEPAPDWMFPSAQKTALKDSIELLISLTLLLG